MKTPNLFDGALKIRHLSLVAALSSEGSVVAAAASLGITQPAASRALREIETLLGVRLYERGAQGLTPTRYGEIFTDYARSVLAQLRQSVRHLAEVDAAERGEVNIGAYLAGTNLLLPRAIAHLKRTSPGVNIVVREAAPAVSLNELKAGRIDMIVGRLTAAGGDTVWRVPLYQEDVRITVGRRHPLVGRQDRIDLDELTRFPWILPGAQTALRQELADYFSRRGRALPTDTIEVTSFLTVRQLLVETDMVAVLPGSIGAGDPRLAVLPHELEGLGHAIGITTFSGRQLTPAARTMAGILQRIGNPLEPGWDKEN
ncbi:LysR substrate-binding domain-containing protein [Enemella sp. A6]|uniref:LysR substrate-binding domain-containing protein n=1 Tax=Enemella sp. A6 TaxID=3440152 RepID=UPI003EC05B38